MRSPVKVLPLITIASLPLTVDADSTYTGIHPEQNSPFQLGVGAFFSTTDYKIRLDDDGDKGTEVDFDDFGIDGADTAPFGFFRWRFTDRWRAEVNGFSTSVSGSDQLTQDIQWGDLDFSVGAKVKASNDMDLLRAAVGYSFVKRDRAELGAGLGLHYLDWETKLSGNATIDGAPVVSASEKARVRGVAPNIALFGNYAINEQWLVKGRFDWISASIGDTSGSLTRIGIALMYQPFKNIGFGAGYDYIDVNVDYEKDANKTSLNGNIQGPQIFATWSF